MRHPVVVLVSLIVGLGCLAGTCRKPARPQVSAPAEDRAPAPLQNVAEGFPSPADRGGSGDATAHASDDGTLATVLFAYDHHDLDAENRRVLQANAERLKKNQNLRILVEGHCDERGTMKYNVALGERRAESVRRYLTSLGVEASRIRIISYGKERPAVAGHEEDAWARNRRAEFKTER